MERARNDKSDGAFLIHQQRHHPRVEIFPVLKHAAAAQPFFFEAELFVKMNARSVPGRDFQLDALDDARFFGPGDGAFHQGPPNSLLSPVLMNGTAKW